MTRLLYIVPGLTPPSSNPEHDKFTFLSEIAEGEVLLPIWGGSPKSVPPFLRETFPIYRRGNFSYHMFLTYRFPNPLRRYATFFFYLRRGLQLHREKKFDAIMTYGTNTPGIAAVFLKWITGTQLIAEIPGAPENAFRYDVPRPNLRAAIKRFFANRLLGFVGKNSDCFKLLYPWQLRKYRSLRQKRIAVFHDFVPAHVIIPEPSQEPYILLAGYPWHTKGADILIRAFKSIASQFPAYKLKVLGYFTDRESLDNLARDCSQIEILDACTNEIALKVIGACSVYVSASRTEGMPRVLLEAMAARKPIIAAAVGGVPYYIKDNDNGLLFQSENVAELAAKLAALLSNPELQARLAERAYEKVFAEYDERSYVRSFLNMLQSLRDESDVLQKQTEPY